MHASRSGLTARASGSRLGAVRSAGPWLRAAATGLLLLLALPGGALADATLIASTPADGAVLTTVPPEAILEFDHPLTGASSFVVLDDSGATAATGEPDPADTTVMRAALPALAPGTYQVRWTAGSDDGHIVRGAFGFTVAAPTAPPPTEAPTAIPTEATPTAQPPTAPPLSTPEPTAAPSLVVSPEAGDEAGGSAGDDLVPIIAVAVLVGGGLIVMLRRRGPA
ncbi:MAG TPA: copper resistance CopC family protein [Candidatus Sulfomarinibacteraceae bacterium]|nr:copper resistance CopC family protein [Candidatus Sulfomarinibacteraceae bacterium]